MNDPYSNPDLFQITSRDQSRRIKLGALLCAAVVVVLLFWGYRYLRAQQLQRVRAAQTADRLAKTPPPAEVQIFEDEARLQGADALIGGSVRNISEARLEGLSLEVELKKRAGQNTELRQLPIEPNSLQPGAEGHYKLVLPSDLWSGARIVRLVSSTRAEDIAFKSAPGARRPSERLPSAPKVIITQRPKSPGEEFINTPDTPTRIP